jgi:hypothetical protein
MSPSLASSVVSYLCESVYTQSVLISCCVLVAMTVLQMAWCRFLDKHSRHPPVVLASPTTSDVSHAATLADNLAKAENMEDFYQINRPFRFMMIVTNNASAEAVELLAERVRVIIAAWQVRILSVTPECAHLIMRRLEAPPSRAQLSSWQDSVFFLYHCNAAHQLCMYIDHAFIGAECLMSMASALSSAPPFDLARMQGTNAQRAGALIRLAWLCCTRVPRWAGSKPATQSSRPAYQVAAPADHPLHYREDSSVHDFIRACELESEASLPSGHTRWAVLYAIVHRVRTVFLAHRPQARLSFYVTVAFPSTPEHRNNVGIIPFDVPWNIAWPEFVRLAEHERYLALATNTVARHSRYLQALLPADSAVFNLRRNVDFIVTMAYTSCRPDDPYLANGFRGHWWGVFSKSEYPLYIGAMTMAGRVHASYSVMDEGVHVDATISNSPKHSASRCIKRFETESIIFSPSSLKPPANVDYGFCKTHYRGTCETNRSTV